jgi:spermidine/putrescine transport system permease protein
MNATARVSERRTGSRALRGYYVLLLALLYLPLAILFVFSFASNTSIAFPLRGFTLEWYQRVFADPGLTQAITNSILVGAASSTVATMLGTCLSVLLVRYNFRGKRLLAGLAVLPLIVPAVVLAVALLALFRALDLPLSFLSIVAAHVVVALPFTTLIVFSRLVGFDRVLEDAAMDLGATYIAALRLIVLPIIFPSVFAAWLVAFTVSFDEVALALFLAGRDPTFPVYLAGHIRFVGNLPILVAAAVLLTVVSLAVILLAERVRRFR